MRGGLAGFFSRKIPVSLYRPNPVLGTGSYISQLLNMPHIHEKIDFAVDVFVVYKDTVLIRKHDKYDKWLAVGGHIELDEDHNQAALREVKEEVGLDVEIVGERADIGEGNSGGYWELLPPRFMNIHNISGL